VPQQEPNFDGLAVEGEGGRYMVAATAVVTVHELCRHQRLFIGSAGFAGKG